MRRALARFLVMLVALAALAGPAAAARGPKTKPKPKRAALRKAAPKSARPPAAPPARGSAASIERLSRGYQLYEGGEYQAAARELRPLTVVHLANHELALYLLAQSEALGGRPEDALAHFHAVAALAGRFAPLARVRAADCAIQLGRLEEARAGYVAAAKAPSPAIEPAVVRFRLAEIEERTAGKGTDNRRAIEAYRKVYDGSPLHPLADRALERMRALDPTAVIAPAERIERAKEMTEGRAWQRALDELKLVPADAPPAVRDEADYWVGTDHFRMRRGYDVAAAKLLGVAPRLAGERGVEAMFHGARAWSRTDLPNGDDRAIAGYRDLVKRFPRARQAPEASFLIGWLDYNRGRYKEALPGLEETLKRYGSSSFGDDARWYLGFARWLSGDTTGALADFSELAKRSGALDGGKGRYWKGRALDKLGRSGEAVQTWRKLAGEFPFSYYALAARARLVEHKAPIGPFGDAPPPSHVTPLGEPDETLAAEPAIGRADELIAAGLRSEAAAELDAADGALLTKYGARIVPLLIDRYERAEDFFHAHRLAEAWGQSALHVDPHADPGAAGWWKHVYPLAYRRFVEKYAETGKNPPYYLYTIMQKESAYNPHDVSYADAIGLLQMIPPTSRHVAERIGRKYTDDVLYDPEGNIQFGAWYIGHLLAKFQGQIALGAGSYNAGPKAMGKWVSKNGTRPADEFVELVAYTQTREYMKKVLDIYARYLYLYDHKDYLPDAAVNPKLVEDDGIDY
jgi:soluble lytic murein transglycosylase